MNEQVCYSCLFMDRRPETGVQGSLIYCQKKKLIVSPKRECATYVRATAQNKQEFRRSLYGTIEAEELE